MKPDSTGEALSRLVAEADVGGRVVKGPMAAIIVSLALAPTATASSSSPPPTSPRRLRRVT